MNGVSKSHYVKLTNPEDPLCDTIDLHDTKEFVNITFDIIQSIRGGFEIKESVEIRIPCDDDNIISPGSDVGEAFPLEKVVNDRGGAKFQFNKF